MCTPIIFFDVNGSCVAGVADAPDRGMIEQQHSGGSWSNAEEASVVLRTMLLLGEDPSIGTIALLTPYKAQVCQRQWCMQLKTHQSAPSAKRVGSADTICAMPEAGVWN